MRNEPILVAIDEALPDRLRQDAAAELVRHLQHGLQAVPEASACLATTSEVPAPGAKSLAALTIGSVSIAVPTTVVLRIVAKIVVAWLERAKARKVTFIDGDRQVVLEALSAKDQHAAVELVLRKLDPETAAVAKSVEP
jgi:hypothetical protein